MASECEDIPKSLDNFVIENIQLGKEIGRGANGRILEANWKGNIVAVKEIHSIFIGNQVSEPEFQAFKRNFLRECEQSSRLRHSNVVRFFGIYHPPGARVPSLVMERLHSSLTNLLERNSIVSIGTKVSIIRDVAKGLRYLHCHTPPIIHRDLSSNNILLSKGMDGKIGDLGTARLVDSKRQSRMTKAPGTIDFMPPEALEAGEYVTYERELDVFSFGCVMLHILSHQWPTPSGSVVTDPITGAVTRGLSEVERRSNYFDKIDRDGKCGTLVPMIESCLNNLPRNRASIMRVCDQLECLVDEEYDPTSTISQSSADLRKTEHDPTDSQSSADLQKRAYDPCTDSQSSADLWKSLKQTWQKCADLPKRCPVVSVAELDGRVYIYTESQSSEHVYMYDSSEDKWSELHEPHFSGCSLVTIASNKQLLAIGGEDKNNRVTNQVLLWDKEKDIWHTLYPGMPTARSRSSSISHRSVIIVLGGVTRWKDTTSRGINTKAVEVLRINDSHLPDSYWSVVEQLPHPLNRMVPFIVENNLYVAHGYDSDGSTKTVATASISELLQSSNENSRSGRVWKKLPDMPYSSESISHYQGHLITFSGDHQIRSLRNLFTKKRNLEWKAVPQIHIYNPITKSWECVGQNPYDYLLGMSVHLSENKFLFLGGVTGAYDQNDEKNLVTTCIILTLAPQ